MVTALGTLVETTRHALSGFDAGKDAVTALAAPLAASDVQVLVEEATPTVGASRGLVEVDFELMRVKRVDPAAGVLHLYPYGRGYRGTDAATHEVGSEVRFNPAWPAGTVAREINGVLTELYPRVYGIAYTDVALPNDRGALTLPDEAVGVVAVWVEDTSRPGQWVREDRWSYRRGGDGLRVGGFHRPGAVVRVEYAKRPTLFDLSGSPSQTFTETTGLDGRLTDLIHLGVAARLAPFVDVSKLPHVAAAAREAGESKAPGVGVSAARFVYSLFQARLDAEAAVLAREHPIRLHFTGGGL